jgi:tRNA(Arg) A34 adenosine deaminase TadA
MKTRQELIATVYDRRGRILSVGHNHYTKTHPTQARYAALANMPHRMFLHAEISALVKCKSSDAYKIKIERYDAKGNPKLAKPCPVCELAIKEAGINFVEYTVG